MKQESQRLFKEVSLSEHCTFGIGGLTTLYCEPESYDELKDVLLVCGDEGYEPKVIGFGANVLFPDKPSANACFVSLKKMIGFYDNTNNEPENEPISSSSNRLSLWSGTPMAYLAIIGYITGIDYDFTHLLPGSIGAGIVMNARYKQREISDIVNKVYYIETDNIQAGIKTLTADNCEFSYKSSIFQQKKNRVILAADFYKHSGNFEFKDDYLPIVSNVTENIRVNSRELCDNKLFNKLFKDYMMLFDRSGKHTPFKEIEFHRNNYEHFKYPSAGSVFKNSRELGKPVGAVVDELGLKGLSSGDAIISKLHGNIIINRGKATAADVLKLIDIIRERIFRKYSLNPELELEII